MRGAGGASLLWADHSTGCRPDGTGIALRRRAILLPVTDYTALGVELEQTWHREIPLAAAIDIGVQGYDGRTLTVRAPLPPNRNLHGTAFAGSLFSVCALAGWGATWLKLREHQLAGLIVLADSQIRYRKAVSSDLVCHCTPAADAVASCIEEFQATGRASLPLTCTFDSGDRPAVTFTGTYVVHAARH